MSDLTKEVIGLASIAVLFGLLVWFAWRDAQRQAKQNKWVQPPDVVKPVERVKPPSDFEQRLAGCGGCLLASAGLFLAVLVVMAILKWMWNLV